MTQHNQKNSQKCLVFKLFLSSFEVWPLKLKGSFLAVAQRSFRNLFFIWYKWSSSLTKRDIFAEQRFLHQQTFHEWLLCLIEQAFSTACTLRNLAIKPTQERVEQWSRNTKIGFDDADFCSFEHRIFETLNTYGSQIQFQKFFFIQIRNQFTILTLSNRWRHYFEKSILYLCKLKKVTQCWWRLF